MTENCTKCNRIVETLALCREKFNRMNPGKYDEVCRFLNMFFDYYADNVPGGPDDVHHSMGEHPCKYCKHHEKVACTISRWAAPNYTEHTTITEACLNCGYVEIEKTRT
jgi:hypothetical protein